MKRVKRLKLDEAKSDALASEKKTEKGSKRLPKAKRLKLDEAVSTTIASSWRKNPKRRAER